MNVGGVKRNLSLIWMTSMNLAMSLMGNILYSKQLIVRIVELKTDGSCALAGRTGDGPPHYSLSLIHI